MPPGPSNASDLQEPFGRFAFFSPIGHASIYLSRVCAESPTRLRLCEPRETGAVISRYNGVAGYGWIAMPLLPYLYAVDRPEGEMPKGRWIQLAGAAYAENAASTGGNLFHSRSVYHV